MLEKKGLLLKVMSVLADQQVFQLCVDNGWNLEEQWMTGTDGK